jgi:hypothetical protein
MFIVVAPAFIAVEIDLHKKSMLDLVASSQENSTLEVYLAVKMQLGPA